MEKNRLFLSSMLFLAVILFSCSESKKDFSYTKGGEILFRNSGIELQIDPKMNILVFYKGEKEPLNVIDAGGPTKPSHYILVDGKEVTHFVVDYDQIKVEPLQTEFGKGRKLTLSGIAELQDGSRIEKVLNVELYEKYPDAALTSAIYKNVGTPSK